MNYELIGIVTSNVGIAILGISEVVGLYYLRRSFQEQLQRNLALETRFQKWEAEKLDGMSQRLDEIMQMLRKGEI